MQQPPPPDAPLAPVQLQNAANIPLPDDLLAEVFRRVSDLASLVRCLHVCRRFYHVTSAVLRAGPFFLGFYHTPNINSLLPQYIHCEPHFTNSNLNLAYLNSETRNHYSVMECRTGRVLLWKMLHGADLHFVLANPIERSSVVIEPLPPPLFDVTIHRLIVCAYVPWTPLPDEEYKLIVVFSDKATGTQFTTMGFSSVTHSWISLGHNQNGSVRFPRRGYQEGREATVFAGRMLYKLQSASYILVVDPSTLLLSMINLPVKCQLYYGNHYIGRTEDDNLCFFMMRKMTLFMWVYRVHNNLGQWFLIEIVDLNGLMDPDVMGEVADMRFSANMGDQGGGVRLATLNGFGEGTGVLVLVLADWVVSYQIKSRRLERLWYSHDWYNRVQEVYVYEMQWPPVPMPAIGGGHGA